MKSIGTLQKFIIEDIIEKFDHIPVNLSDMIRLINNSNQLKKIYAYVINCTNLDEITNFIYYKEEKYGRSAFKYKQNYDAVVKWIAQEFKGKTLKIFGIDSSPIADVFTFEPIEIKIHTGRLDLIFKTIDNENYHFEEQRNMTEEDLFRCSVYHFQSAQKFGLRITDILLISGRKYNGPNQIKTNSGLYKPIIIDLTTKDANKRFEEIKQEIYDANYENLIELVFLPLYGDEKKINRSCFAKEVIRFEIDLLKKDRFQEKLVVATLIMCNKIIENYVLQDFYEEIKNMLDILEIARNDGIQQGVQQGVQQGIKQGVQQGLQQGVQQGMLLDAREMVLDVIGEKIGVVPQYIAEKINAINTRETLKSLLRQAVKCNDIKSFEESLKFATS